MSTGEGLQSLSAARLEPFPHGWLCHLISELSALTRAVLCLVKEVVKSLEFSQINGSAQSTVA